MIDDLHYIRLQTSAACFCEKAGTFQHQVEIKERETNGGTMTEVDGITMLHATTRQQDKGEGKGKTQDEKQNDKKKNPDHEDELLDEGLDESFPASDPPAVNPGK